MLGIIDNGYFGVWKSFKRLKTTGQLGSIIYSSPACRNSEPTVPHSLGLAVKNNFTASRRVFMQCNYIYTVPVSVISMRVIDNGRVASTVCSIRYMIGTSESFDLV